MKQYTNNWKWGIFYYATNDYRMIVPKKNPVFGLTSNFAHPYSYSWFLIIGTIALALIVAIMP
jgi:uncharacterized membrane protein